MAERFRRGEEVRGIGFPIDKSKDGYWGRKNAKSLRQTSLLMILGTHPGERLMLPEFGSRLHELVFEPGDALTCEQIKHETASALQRWDPYVTVLAVATEIEGDTIHIFIDFSDKRDPTEQPRRMTFTSGG
jgi:hypothetical protein